MIGDGVVPLTIQSPRDGAECKYGQWIPVSEKLPPISEEVIVCTYTNMIRIWSLERYYPTVADILWEREDGYYEDASEVTHWMPLPQPPESEELNG